MKWSPQQEQALTAVADWLEAGEQQIFRLFGYAGSGKTTLAKHFAEGVRDVCFAAYTGKAAHVLSQKGCPASTIHQLIYTPKNKSKARLTELEVLLVEARKDGNRKVQMELEAEIKVEEDNLKRMWFQLNMESKIRETELVVIDECSMVDDQMASDLLSFNKPVLVLGDPAQLPPVKGSGYFTEAEPDFMLTEVHRQAQESPIIAMATKVRNRERLEVGQYGNCAVHAKGTRIESIVADADQLICGRNKTRFAANKRVRQMLGFESSLPVAGDRMVCLKNNHKEGLLNGQIWIAGQPVTEFTEDFYWLQAYNEDSETQSTQEFKVWNREPEWYEVREAEQFEYGYCLTCHKSQGSQWDHVVVMDESWCFRRDRYRWLYTAITRAAERVDIVEM